MTTLLYSLTQEVLTMKTINQYPKSITKAIRYIKQDANVEQLDDIKKLLESAIETRRKKSELKQSLTIR